MSARDAVVTALIKIHEQGSYSNIVLDDMLETVELSAADRAFASRLMYGVIEHRLTLDFVLNYVSVTPVKEMKPAVREILRVATYQIIFMDKVPNFAAINEAVEQTRRFRCSRLSGFVNGVLRQVGHQYDDLLCSLPDTDKGLEIRFSIPREWVRIWRDVYGPLVMIGLLCEINEAPPSFLRINTHVTTIDDFCARLDERGIEYERFSEIPNALLLKSAAALHTLPTELHNHYYFQDAASQWSCLALDAQPGERIADVCAAPGGKSMTVAQYMHDEGEIISGDLHDHKCRAMAQRVKDYGFSCISVRQRDASLPPFEDEIGTFDRVICDVPCSGMGVIRRKPEIRYKKPAEFADLPALQLQILQQAAALVKPGGVLQYSTCTLHPLENEEVVSAFLEQNPDFEPRILPIPDCFRLSNAVPSHQITLFPNIHETDGFFIAGFTKKA